MKRRALFVFLLLLVCQWGYGQPILFVSEVAGQADLYVCEEDGSGLRRITNTADYELMAAVSPDGRKIVFAASPFIEGKFKNPQIFLTDFKVEKINQITHNEKVNISPTFSPDGQKIAFSSMAQDFSSDIYIVDLNGGNLRKMTASPAYEANPAWGDRGATLLYQMEFAGPGRIMKMGAQGIASFEALEGGMNFSPSWGVGEKNFIYGVVAAQATATTFILADRDGRTVKKITNKEAIKSHPHLSSDGEKIVYEQNKVERSGVFVMNLEGESVREIGIKDNHNFAPVWVSQRPEKQQRHLPVPPNRQINDDAGNVIQITPQNLPDKIISLSPALTEVIFALGESKKLKGVTLRANYPPAAKLIPSVGSYGAPDWEKIKQIKPQYVFLSTSLQKKFIPRLEEMGVKAVLFNPGNIEEVFNSFTRISLILSGSRKSAEKLINQIKKEIAEIAKVVQQVKQPKRIYLEINGPKNLYTVGRSSFMGDLMNRAGVINVFSQKKESYPKITDEEIIKANPDVIIIDHPLQFKKGVKKRSGWQVIKAVKENQVYDAQDFNTLILDRPGPRIAQAIKIIARMTYPEIFPTQ